MKTNKKMWLSILPLATIATPLIAVSCGETKKVNTPKTVKGADDEVIFRLAQGSNWPLAQALSPLIDYYNKTQSTKPDYVKVNAEFGEKTNIYKEFDLIKNIKDNFENGTLKSLPNLILGAQSGAYVINQDGRLLDVADTGVNKALFDDKIANLHSRLSGQEDDRLYNIPFDNADVDSLTLNLDLLHKMFELIKQGGGTVDETAEIVMKAKEASTKGSSIPAHSIWLALRVKNNNAYAGLTVNDATFTSLKGVRDLSAKFTQGVALDETKVTDKTIGSEVLSIDYQENTFLKELHANIPANKSVFELEKTGDVNQPTRIKYNLVEDATVQAAFKSLWTAYNESIVRHEKRVGEDNKVFQSVKYMQNLYSEWGSWEVMLYKSAISYAASVGANQNKKTPWSKAFFTQVLKKQTVEQFETNASDEDVLMKPQITLAETGKPEFFQEGGSSIIPVDVKNERLNKATKAFIKWLYTGQNDINTPGTMEENWKTFAKGSGYIIPLKSVTTKETETWIKSEIEALDAKIKAVPANTTDEAILAKQAADIKAKNFLKSSLVSLQSILRLSDTTNPVKTMDLVTDDKTAAMETAIATAMFDATKISGNSQKTADEMVRVFTSAKSQ
ncbi:P68 family surface lipoprotein [Mycoplasma simbae]|uniref:P68 family surface lipoprotein n=1 Tax=Mycoplasma simbae TaxID=36744 RepID=UPI0004955F44|nr:hypothetical protein [Mycoplasma simbae]